MPLYLTTLPLPPGLDDFHLSIHSDMAAIVKAMASPESGLEVRDRMWLKITIPNAFIGERALLQDEGQVVETWNGAGGGVGGAKILLGLLLWVVNRPSPPASVNPEEPRSTGSFVPRLRCGGLAVPQRGRIHRSAGGPQVCQQPAESWFHPPYRQQDHVL